MTIYPSDSGTSPEIPLWQRNTCMCIESKLEHDVTKSRRRRSPDTPTDLPPSTRVSPCVVLISEKESCQIWACRWSSNSLVMQRRRILYFDRSVQVHFLLDADGPSSKVPLTLQEVATERAYTEGCCFALEEISKTEEVRGNVHRRGVLGAELPRFKWNGVDVFQSSYVLALPGPPSPLVSLTVRIVQLNDHDSPPCTLQVASWKRQLCGTIVIYCQSKGITTTVELRGLDGKKVKLQITALGSRSCSPQMMFVVLPSTRITVQQKSAASIAPAPPHGMPVWPSGTPKTTLVLLQAIFCAHHKIHVPRTFLLSGPAGVGKTYSVKRVLELCTLPLHLVSLRGSDVLQDQTNASQTLEQEFLKAANLTDKMVIVFLDECDALVSVESVAATLSYLLDRVFTEWTNILVVGATNRLDSLPGYLRRSGRFDKEIPLSPPNVQERASILTSLLEQRGVQGQIDASTKVSASTIQQISELCVGYVPADLNALIRKATLLAKQEGPAASVLRFIDRAMSEVGPSALRDVLLASPPKITWDDIAGDPGGAKTALRQAIEWPRTKSAAFTRLGLIPPRGILLHGPPGCAKTTLARAAAGASGVAFLSLSPADVYSSSFVGEAEAVVRRAFSLARSAAPCVLFFDEIDAIFGSAHDGGRGSSAEARVLSTFLNEMDGIDNNSGVDGVLVLGATNRPWTLDSALVRPGRLGDKVIYIPPPDAAARRAILEMQFPRLSSDMNLDWLSCDDVTGMLTGAELVGACQQSKLEVLRTAIKGSEIQALGGLRLEEHLVTVIRSRKPLLSDPDAWHKTRIFEQHGTGK
jgi:SpoVK/Ycf46/Vps4 family AAA+-type ATPase